jgi:hypothetical protein
LSFALRTAELGLVDVKWHGDMGGFPYHSVADWSECGFAGERFRSRFGSSCRRFLVGSDGRFGLDYLALRLTQFRLYASDFLILLPCFVSSSTCTNLDLPFVILFLEFE